MKKTYTFFLLAGMMMAFVPKTMAQHVADFENLSLNEESYYDGSSDHSGTQNATETFPYVSGGITFPLSSSYWGSEMYSYGGMAYSNQTDVTTASYTNYSAYASPAGGAESSQNYGVYYPGYGTSDSLLFSQAANLESVFIANHVWAYHYIMGTDGSGTGTFVAGDYLTLTIMAYNLSGEVVGTVEVKLADYTEGNTDVISNWTEIDLSSLENVSYIKFQISSNDTMCPTYFCIDNLSYSETTGNMETEMASINLYPNPVTDYVNISNAKGGMYTITDSYGRVLNQGEITSENMKISTSDYAAGLYVVTIDYHSERIVKKIIK